MGWACPSCGDLNRGEAAQCAECRTARGARIAFRLEPQPMNPNLIWLATLFGGTLAGYTIALWNLRLLKPRQFALAAVIYGLIAIGGWLLSVYLLAVLTGDYIGPLLPAFGLLFALAVSFLLVSIPYNRDTLAVLQWTWSHPLKKLVIKVGRRQGDESSPSLSLTPIRVGYTAFAKAEGQLFAEENRDRPLTAIPIIPPLVLILSAAIGYLTLLLANHFV